MKKLRQIVIYKHYFNDFFVSLDEKVKEKFDYVLYLITIVEKIPKKFFKRIKGVDGLYEIRVESLGNIYRIFCCFDEGKLVVLFNGFLKKTNKIPKQQIEMAEKLKKEYFNKKQKG